jgi:hypothetical protein
LKVFMSIWVRNFFTMACRAISTKACRPST